MKKLMFIAVFSLLRMAAFAQVSADEVHEAILSYRCKCEQPAFAAMSEDAQRLLLDCGAMPDEILEKQIEEKRETEKWSVMVLDYMNYELTVLSSCPEEDLRAQLKKQFPKGKDAAGIEEALNGEPDEGRLFFWSMRNEGCDFVRGFTRLMNYRAIHPEVFEIDFELEGGEGN